DLQERFGLYRLSDRSMHQAIRAFAAEEPRNAAQEWLSGLVWDGTPRIDAFLTFAFGVPPTDYSRAVSANFFKAVVRRVMEPGCKVDTMLVLEGEQGQKKSTALDLLGAPWYLDCKERIGSDNFTRVLTGKTIVEIAELDSFRGMAWERIKQTLS